jgi:hypothetical protein
MLQKVPWHSRSNFTLWSRLFGAPFWRGRDNGVRAVKSKATPEEASGAGQRGARTSDCRAPFSRTTMHKLKGFSLPSSLPSFSSPASSPPATSPPLPESVVESLEARKNTVRALLAAFTSFHNAASKERSNPYGGYSNETALPIAWLGEHMAREGDELQGVVSGSGEDVASLESLRHYGECFCKICPPPDEADAPAPLVQQLRCRSPERLT